MYLESYSHMITPLLDPNMLEEIEIKSPPLSRMPNKPRMSKRRKQDEGPVSIKPKRSTIMKCSNCQ